MINQSNNPDRDSLEDELEGLDIPIVMLDAAVMILCDKFDIDPGILLRAMVEGRSPDLADQYDAEEVNTVMDIIYEGIESTTQLPHVLRAIEIHQLTAEMED